LQAGIDQFDIGYRDRQITAENHSLVEQPVQQFEQRAFLEPSKVCVVFHGESFPPDDPAGRQCQRQSLRLSGLAIRVQDAFNLLDLFQEPGLLGVEFPFVDLA
jgi:hypothetical protein